MTKPPRKTKGTATLTFTLTGLTLITTGYQLTTYKPTWTITLTTLTAITALAVMIPLKIRSNTRYRLLPYTYAQLLTNRAKFPLEPSQIKLSRFHTPDTKNPFKTGIPRRIALNHEQVILAEKTDLTETLSTLHHATGALYRLNPTKSKDHGRLTFDALTPAELAASNSTPKLTYRESIEHRLTTTAHRLIDEHATITYTWEENDYLTAVDITGFQTTDIALPNKRKQIMLQLKTALPKGDFNTHFDAHDQVLRFYRSTPLPTVTVPPKAKARLLKTHEDYLNFKIRYGIAADNKVAYWQPAKDAHLLAIGGTGGGKTIFEHGIIQQLCQAGARVWLLDGKRVEFKGYRNYPNVEILAQKIEHQVRLVKIAFDLMEARYDLIEKDKVAIADLEPVFLVIDEVKTFLASAERLYKKTKEKGMPARSEVLDWLSDMGSLARTAKIHLVFGLQRPDAEFIGGELRDNFGARISLGQLQSSQGSLMMWNNPAIGVQVPKIPGRAISLIDGVPGQVQVPFTANPDPQHKDFVASMVAATYPEWEIYSRKVIEDIQPEPVLDKNHEYTGEDVLLWSSLISAKVLDPKTGKSVAIPVVASDESKALRASNARDLPVEEIQLIPQVADSFPDALELFEEATDLKHGGSVARALQRTMDIEEKQDLNQLAAASYFETMQRLNNSELAYSSEKEISAEKIAGGMKVTDPDTGEKIIVSETEITEGSDMITVIGLSDEGEEIILELPSNKKIECAEMLEV